MHHMAVIFDVIIRFHPDRSGPCNPANVISSQIKQHQMFGAFFDIRHQIRRIRRVFIGGGATLAGTGNRPDGDCLIAQPDKNFRARPNHRHFAEIKIK